MQRILCAKLDPLAIGADRRWRAEANEEVGFISGKGIDGKREEHFVSSGAENERNAVNIFVARGVDDDNACCEQTR